MARTVELVASVSRSQWGCSHQVKPWYFHQIARGSTAAMLLGLLSLHLIVILLGQSDFVRKAGFIKIVM